MLFHLISRLFLPLAGGSLMDLDVFRLFIYSVAASVVFCFYSFLENHHGGECDCSGRPLPHVLNSRFVSEKRNFPNTVLETKVCIERRCSLLCVFVISFNVSMTTRLLD